jgi:hypothetical protein
MATRRELVEAVGERYRSADRASKGKVLDEFVAVTGLHRKHTMRVLRTKAAAREAARPERRIYTEAARTALITLWEASDRLCGKRLRPLMPILIEAVEGHGHLDLEPTIRTKLLQMSAATIDRALRTVKESGLKPRRRGVIGSELRRSIPIRTFGDWGDPAPGHIEADLVSHSGPVAKGSWAWTLTLTDIATGWTECAPLLVRCAADPSRASSIRSWRDSGARKPQRIMPPAESQFAPLATYSFGFLQNRGIYSELLFFFQKEAEQGKSRA